MYFGIYQVVVNDVGGKQPSTSGELKDEINQTCLRNVMYYDITGIDSSSDESNVSNFFFFVC